MQSAFQRWYSKPKNKVAHAKRVHSWYVRNKSQKTQTTYAWREKHPVRHAYSRYKANAKKRGLDFVLVFDHFADLVTDNCFYCTSPPDPINGVDRVDNARGYVEDNVVTACPMCNQAKHTHSRADFESWALRLGSNLTKWAN